MKTEHEMVREFMRAFGQRVPDGVEMPGPELVRLRHRLTEEENDEMRDACDVVAYFDACLDKLYVALGDCVAAGFTAEQIAKGFAEVHRSNMSKMWDYFEIEPGIPEGCTCTHVTEEAYIVRRADGKVVKSPSYSPANLGPILEAKR